MLGDFRMSVRLVTSHAAALGDFACGEAMTLFFTLAGVARLSFQADNLQA